MQASLTCVRSKEQSEGSKCGEESGVSRGGKMMVSTPMEGDELNSSNPATGNVLPRLCPLSLSFVSLSKSHMYLTLKRTGEGSK